MAEGESGPITVDRSEPVSFRLSSKKVVLFCFVLLVTVDAKYLHCTALH